MHTKQGLRLLRMIALAALTLTSTSCGPGRDASEALRSAIGTCVRPPSNPEPGSVALDPADPADAAIRERFAGICTRLRREPGLVFGDGNRTYTCHVVTPHIAGRANETHARVKALGLSPAASDLLDYIQLAERIASWEYTFIISARENGEIVSLLEHESDLGRVKSVASASAAVDFLSLKGVLGFLDDKALCSAGLVTSPDGWTITVPPRNCDAKLRDIKVTRTGEVGIVGERNALETSCIVY